MKAALLVLALVGASLALSATLAENRAQFLQFQQKYGKSYNTQEEFDLRFRNFQSNMLRAKDLAKKNPRATFGVNKFSDLSEQEFASMYLMNSVEFKKNYVAPEAKDFSKTVRGSPLVSCNPNSVNYDWTSCGVTTPVYNQGQCGSCWAFSATETIESYFALAGNPLTSLAVSQIVDCDTNGEDEGCNGGFPSGAYQYVESAGGLESAEDYAYSAESGESGSCAFNAEDLVATISGYQSISGETGLYQQLSTSSQNGGGPVSICVDASSWSSYTGGVLSQCGTTVDHCVQLTGYANYGQSGAYWIVRNSWGEDWGNSGFIYLEIGEDLCEIGDYATIVTGAAPASTN